jgi:hypothetical protein
MPGRLIDSVYNKHFRAMRPAIIVDYSRDEKGVAAHFMGRFDLYLSDAQGEVRNRKM